MSHALHGLNGIVTRLLEVAVDLGRYQQGTAEMPAFWQFPPDGQIDFDATGNGLAAVAKRLLKEADDRERYFAAEMFSDPVWRILLDLYIHAAERRQVSVSSACLAARVPNTTALRVIGDLVERRVVARSADPNDGRRHHLTLSPANFANMSRYLAGIAGIDPVIARSHAAQTGHAR